MSKSYINRIATAVPAHDIHAKFVDYAPSFLGDLRSKKLFRIMADRAQIENRYSVLAPHPQRERLDQDGFYRKERFPDTRARMEAYEAHAFALARKALDSLGVIRDVTHLIVTTCTGFYAPGLDIDIVRHYGLSGRTERSILGFMGCAAAISALRAARHIVRSHPEAKVMIVNIELCTLHLKEAATLEELLSYLVFGDGCAACIVSAEPLGLEICGFETGMMPASEKQITWRVGQNGFDMELSGEVPGTIRRLLGENRLHSLAVPANDVGFWAVHPGGRSVLDAVEGALALPSDALVHSRGVLRKFGNMSSATVMFVLNEVMESATGQGHGRALAFGPGIAAEAMSFRRL